MARTLSTMLELGTTAPDFNLPDTDGAMVSRDRFAGKPLLVIFMCNHCPYVIHIRDKLLQLAKSYGEKGVAVVAINSNDAQNYPDDSPEKMKEAAAAGFSFPYLYDEDQATAKAYRAACTPDFFLFDENHRLVYRGQFDDARPRNEEPVTGKDLSAAVESLLAGRAIGAEQKPSMGCNIKWKAGNEPDYFQ